MGQKTLHSLLKLKRPIILGGAHDGLSACLIEEAGFDGVWASSFGISASHCLPDAGILTMKECLEVAMCMGHSVQIPIIADCDNGYGNSINAMRTVRQYESAGVDGLSIEDNDFPKRCSFYTNVSRHLEEMEQFCKKIRAAINARKTDDFFIIARTEALIAGLGIEEAKRRAEAYAEVGADAILIHSKSKDAKELLEIGRAWSLSAPLVAIPTTYPHLSSSFLYRNGFKIIIFANQGVRASLRAQRKVYRLMKKSGRADSASKYIDSIDDVNKIVGLHQLQEDERNYL